MTLYITASVLFWSKGLVMQSANPESRAFRWAVWSPITIIPTTGVLSTRWLVFNLRLKSIAESPGKAMLMRIAE